MNKHLQIPSLLLLIILVAFPQISETIFTPSLPDITTYLGVSNNSTQLTLSVYFLGFAGGVFFWGWLSDFIGRRPAMLGGLIFYCIGTCMCYGASTLDWLLISRVIQAFGAATGSIITQTILRESVSGNKRHAMFAQISAALAFTPAIGPLIGGIIDQFFGFKAVFLTLSMLSVLLFIYTFLRLPETTKVTNLKRTALRPIIKSMIRNKRVLTFGLLIGILNGLLFSYYAEAPFIFIKHFGLTPILYGLLGVVVALAAVIGSLISKRLLAIMKPEKIIHLGCFIVIIGSTLLIAITSLHHFYGTIFTLALILIGSGIALPNCLSLALVDYHHVAGTAGALFSLGYYIVVSLITFGMSYFHDGSLYTMPLYFFILGIIMYSAAKKFIRTFD